MKEEEEKVEEKINKAGFELLPMFSLFCVCVCVSEYKCVCGCVFDFPLVHDEVSKCLMGIIFTIQVDSSRTVQMVT